MVIGNLRKEGEGTDKKVGRVICSKLNLKRNIIDKAIEKQEASEPMGQVWMSDISAGYLKRRKV